MKKENKINWWNSMTPSEKQYLTNNFYCKFKQVFWKDVPLTDVNIMFFRINKLK